MSNKLPADVLERISQDAIYNNLKEWCYTKRTELERANSQWPLFNCMDQAIISVLADMEFRLMKIEAKFNSPKPMANKQYDETGRIFINEILLVDAGFRKIEKDGFDLFIKDKIEILDFNGEHWVVDMLDQAGIEKEFKYMDELEIFFQACGLSFYN